MSTDDTLADIDAAIDDYVTWHGSIDAASWSPEREATDVTGHYGDIGTNQYATQGSVLPRVEDPETVPYAHGEGCRCSACVVERRYDLTPGAIREQRRAQTRDAVNELAERYRQWHEQTERQRAERQDAQILALLRGEIERSIGEPVIGVTAFRSWERHETDVVALAEHVDTRWVLDDESHWYDDRSAQLYFRLEGIRRPGQVSWHQIPRDIVRRGAMSWYDPVTRSWEESSSVQSDVRTRTIAPLVIHLQVPTTDVRSMIQGVRAPHIVVDEVTQAMAQVGQAAARAAAQIAEFTETAREEVSPAPALPAPTVRRGLDGQRSPYGPPQHGRRR